MYDVLLRLDLHALRDDRARERVVEACLEALAVYDEEYLIAQQHTPPIYRAGVRYIDDSDARFDAFKGISFVLYEGGGDCDDLVPWRVAELRRRNVPARCMAHVTRDSDGNMLCHALVRVGNETEDPSKILGMR